MKTATSDTERALYAAIVAHPDEDTVRLEYADWLQEHGDENRAEFIRVQCELARMPPKPRELFVTDGEGKMLEGLGVSLIPRGDGHYSASNQERGLSIETFAPNERVDIYAHLARNDRIGWMRGLKFVKHVEGRHEIIFRKDAESGPWKGTALKARESALLTANREEWLRVSCPKCVKGWTIIPYREGEIGGGFGYCPACDGRGDIGGLTEMRGGVGIRDATGEYRYPVTFRRGFPYSVGGCRLTGVFERIHDGFPDDDGWHLAPWILRVFTHHPTIRRVPLVDGVPFYDHAQGHGWRRATVFPAGETWGALSDIPTFLFDALRGGDYLEVGRSRTYRAAELATDALAEAVADVVRESLTRSAT